MAAYLRTDVTWADRFSNVWLWMDWPGRQGKPDTGIDLVAEERDGGGLTAIQCKFYAPTHTLQKRDIDSFFTASGKAGFASRLIVSTTDKWSKHAEDALERPADPGHPAARAGPRRVQHRLVAVQPAHARGHGAQGQEGPAPAPAGGARRSARRACAADRGKLIMACGTGKTFTALRIAEDRVAPGGSVLFLVPSISLLSQTLREWTAEAEVPLAALRGLLRHEGRQAADNEDISPYDLAFPASTDAAKLARGYRPAATTDKITVVFSTYQSLRSSQRAGSWPA